MEEANEVLVEHKGSPEGLGLRGRDLWVALVEDKIVLRDDRQTVANVLLDDILKLHLRRRHSALAQIPFSAGEVAGDMTISSSRLPLPICVGNSRTYARSGLNPKVLSAGYDELITSVIQRLRTRASPPPISVSDPSSVVSLVMGVLFFAAAIGLAVAGVLGSGSGQLWFGVALLPPGAAALIAAWYVGRERPLTRLSDALLQPRV